MLYEIRAAVLAASVLGFSSAAMSISYQSVTCDGGKSEDGNSGDYYGFELVGNESGSYKIHQYFFSGPSYPPETPYRAFSPTELDCSFFTPPPPGMEGDLMTCRLPHVSNCLVIGMREKYGRVSQTVLMHPTCKKIAAYTYDLYNHGCKFHEWR